MNRQFLDREPWWAPGTDSGFRRRCASALTHPFTVVALATLLLNDLVLKAIWSDAWVTGKLSDLAWVVFALPLLAFLLSLITRGSVIAARAAFLMAYAGLPLLYAAFNTFEPVHYWILRGIAVASGGMGRTPLDATDSIVIPLGWAVAVWVWRRPALSPDALRLRLGLLVAGVAVLASIATSEPELDHGIQSLGVIRTGDGSAVVTGNWRRSDDGGVTWEKVSGIDPSIVEWGYISVETPKGTFSIEGQEILQVGDDGSSQVAYSTGYLAKRANYWVQKQHTTHLGVRILATEPSSIVYDERSGNLVVALGIQGVLVGTPEGNWTPYAVGSYMPTDFSFAGKSRLLLTTLEFLAMLLSLSLSLIGGGLILSQHRREDSRLMAPAVLVALALAVGFPIAFWIGFGTLLVLVPLLLVAPIAAGIAFGSARRRNEKDKVIVLGIGILAYLASGSLLFAFGGSNPETADFSELLPLGVGAVALLMGTTAVAVSWRQLRYWGAILVSLVSINSLVVLAFMLWLHLGIPLILAKVSAFALTTFVAFLLAGHVRRKTSESTWNMQSCPRCKHRNEVTSQFCTNCGGMLGDKPRPIGDGCPRCNQWNSAEEWFCTRCGYQIRQELSGPAGVCQYCQHENEETALFCANCGRPL